MYKYIKLALDFILALIMLVPTAIVVGICAIFIKLEDGGPVFYIARRTGLNGKPFNMYKLRSMMVNAPDIRLADGSTYNGENDPRVTKFGRFARKTSVDELPQIFNVLKGDMSFVGPRPDSASYLDQYTEEERQILKVRPGITGYNQAINRNAAGTKEKLQNDIYYVQNISFAFDVKIILLTVKAVLGHKNVYRSENVQMENEVSSDEKTHV